MKYVIDFYNHVDELVIDQYLVDNNITKLKQLESFGKVYLVESENEIVITDLIENLSADADQPVNLLSFTIDLVDNYTETSFDIEDEKNWWKVATINKIDFDQQIHTHKIRGANSTVYIIDSGITIDHPEFVGANIELLHSFNGNFVDNNGHGTGLSSLIVGPTCGLANPRLKVVKLFDNTQPTLQSDMLIALDAVLNDFVTNGKKASVVNMSWSIPRNDYVNAKIQYMINQGMHVIAAAGNSGIPIGDVTPASIPDVLTIGSFNQNLEPSSFSNYTGGSDISYTGSDVNYGSLDGWAPGELIWAANKNGSYGYIAGTSAAAAIACAVFAYNTEMLIVDGEIFESSIEIYHKFEAYNGLVLSRENILDLSDERYNNSANRIATVYSNVAKSTYNYLFYVQANKQHKYLFFNPVIVKSISIENELPEFVSIQSNGVLEINYPEISEDYIKVLPSINITVSQHGDTDTLPATLKITILKSSYNNIRDVINDNPNVIEDEALKYALLNDSYCEYTEGTGCVDIYVFPNDCGNSEPPTVKECRGFSKATCACVNA